MVRRLPLFALLAVLPACHGSTAPGGGSPPGPLVLPPIPYGGGRTMPDMKVVPIFYENDRAQPYIESFLKVLAAHQGGLDTWIGAVEELGGMNTLTIAPSVVLHERPPARFDDWPGQGGVWLRQFLRDKVAEGTLPPYEKGMIYVLYPPLVTQTTLGTFQGCVDYVGYHNHDPNFTTVLPATPSDGGSATPADALPDWQDVVYAVILRCTPPGIETVNDEITAVTSHELAEAATDPDLDAWVLGLFNAFDEGENGDLCAWEPGYVTSGGTSFAFQRMWSNSADEAGADPCVPAPAKEQYANAIPFPTAIETVAGTTVHFDLRVVAPGSIDGGSPVDGGSAVGGMDIYAAFGIYKGYGAQGGFISACSPTAKFFVPSGTPCYTVGSVIGYDIPLPPDLAPGNYWLNVFNFYGDQEDTTFVAPTSQAFAGVHVLAR